MFFLPFIALFFLSFVPDGPMPEVNYSIGHAYQYTDHDRKMLDDSVLLLNKVVNEPCFRNAFLKEHFTEMRGMTNRAALRTLLQGLDGQGNMRLYMIEYDNPHVNIIGFVRFDIPKTVFQNHFYMWNKFAMAANILHESLHLVGFMHDDEKHMYTTVPYRASELFLNCISFEDAVP